MPDTLLSQDSLFLGIDGGGTNCRARLVNASGDVLGEGHGGTANTLHGIDAALSQVMIATTKALKAAGLDNTALPRIHAGLGLAGLSIDRDREATNAWDHPFASLIAHCDAHIACMGAHQGQNGGIVIFGTGSCGYGLADGESVRVGGWGFRLSDQGSGAQAGYAALRAALLHLESGQPINGFCKEMLKRFKQNPQQAVLWAESAKPADYGSFAPTVVKWAERGDAHAIAVMEQSGRDGGLILEALINRGIDKISLIGGFADPLTEWLPDHVQRCLTPANGDPMAGALLMARQHADSLTEVPA